MSIQFRAGRKSPWRVQWYNPHTGKRESRCFEREADARKFDARQSYLIKYEPENIEQQEAEQQKETGITLDAAYLEYLREKNYGKKNLEKHFYCMRPVLAALGQKPVDAISKADISMLAESMSPGAIKAITIKCRLSIFRAVLRWAHATGLRGPVDFPQMPTACYERFVPPTPAEVAAIMAVASPHIQRVIVLGAQCGCRVGPCELLGLQWNDVDLSRGILRVHGAKKNLNAPWREVPIRQALLPVFAQWQDEDAAQGIPWLVHFNGKPIKHIKTAWRCTLKRAGITRRMRPYDLRHAFGTELVAAGVDVGTVASLMGHSNPTMLLTHYQYIGDRQKVAAIEKLPDYDLCVVPKIVPKIVPKQKWATAATVTH